MKTNHLFFIFVLLCIFSFSACRDEAVVPEPEKDIPRVRDISITEANLQWVEDGLAALNMDIGIIPGAAAPQGSFSIRIYEEGRLLHAEDFSLAGIPSEACCERGKCVEVENMTYTCDALCDSNSRSDGCNYHLQKQVFLPLERSAAIRLALNEDGAIRETDDAARSNNSLHLSLPAPPEIPQPENPGNPYDEVGRWHNELLQTLLHRMDAAPGFAGLLPDDQQRAVLEWAVTEAMAIGESAASFAMPRFLYAYAGSEEGLMREVDLKAFKLALERLELDDDNRSHLAKLYELLQGHPLEEQADIVNLLGAIRHLEAAWMQGREAASVEVPLIAASVARYSLCFWAARQPAPFQGPQLFGIREGFFADAFGGGIGAAAGAIAGPKGALIGGLIGGVTSSVIFAID